jgi:dTDP-4-amino-4,6-dideoxygalactose transaminase
VTRKIPMVDLSAQTERLWPELEKAVHDVLRSGRFILGPNVETFEREAASFLGTRYAVGVGSGTDALVLGLRALGVGPGDEVIVPSFTFFATAEAVSLVGATPVFADIEPTTFCLEPDAIAKAISLRTRAIVPVHLFGHPAEMDALGELARSRGLALLEDAAQAFGAVYRGRKIGGLGNAAAFSFFPSKNLGAFGDGGLVTTNDARLAHELRLLRNHGMEPKYYHQRVGGNFRLDALQAAVLRVKAPHLDAWTEARRRNANRYRQLVAEFRLDRILDLPVEPAGYRHIYNQFVIRGDRRDELRAHLTACRIGTEIYYPVPFHRQACFEDLPSASDAFPHADAAAARSLALPIYGELTEAQQRHVVASIAEFYDRTA